MADAQQPVGEGAVEASGRPPRVTFAGRRSERTPVAVTLGRWTLPGLFSVLGHHGSQVEPRFDSGRLLDEADGLTAVQPRRRSYLRLRSAPFFF